LQMKPYFEECKRLMHRAGIIDPENNKQKLKFSQIFHYLDCPEFYERVPKYCNSRESLSNVKLVKAAMIILRKGQLSIKLMR